MPDARPPARGRDRRRSRREGRVVAAVATDTEGTEAFDNIAPGSYDVGVDAAPFPP